MTVIVAALTRQGVVLAGDRQILRDWQKLYHEEPKLWIEDELAFGAAGSIRDIQVIKYHVDWPRYRKDEDRHWEAWLVRRVVPAIRDGAANHGVLSIENGVSSIESDLLLCTANKIAVITGGGAVLSEVNNRMAIGSGYAEALGYLGMSGPWTEKDVIEAVRVASYNNNGCGGPITVINAKSLTVKTVE